MDIIKTGFGKCLKNARKSKKYTQEYLSEQMGINMRQLAKIEAGQSFVTSDTLYKICTILNISPSELFDFDITEELKTGTGQSIHYSVIKSGNLIQLADKRLQMHQHQLSDFDEKMLALAKSLKKDITVDEISDGVISITKIFKPNGEVNITSKNAQQELYQSLKNKLVSISQDKKKLDFINLSFEAIANKDALQKLKIIIQGIELTQ